MIRTASRGRDRGARRLHTRNGRQTRNSVTQPLAPMCVCVFAPVYVCALAAGRCGEGGSGHDSCCVQRLSARVAMAHRKCQVCRMHRPRRPRVCFRCRRLVGPGCWSRETSCLATELPHLPLQRGRACCICYPCHRALRSEILAVSAGEQQLWILLFETGF